jgi:hypothetical protein
LRKEKEVEIKIERGREKDDYNWEGGGRSFLSEDGFLNLIWGILIGMVYVQDDGVMRKIMIFFTLQGVNKKIE